MNVLTHVHCCTGQAVWQEFDGFRVGQQTQAEDHQAALQTEVAARQAAEAAAIDLETQVAQLKNGLSQVQNQLQIMVRLLS